MSFSNCLIRCGDRRLCVVQFYLCALLYCVWKSVETRIANDKSQKVAALLKKCKDQFLMKHTSFSLCDVKLCFEQSCTVLLYRESNLIFNWMPKRRHDCASNEYECSAFCFRFLNHKKDSCDFEYKHLFYCFLIHFMTKRDCENVHSEVQIF